MQPSAGESDEGFEAGFGFFVSGGESTEALEFAEAAFDAIALFVEVFVVLALYLAIPFGRDHGFGSHRFNVLYDGVSIVALVGVDQAAAVQLLRDCRRIRSDARAEEIAFFIEEKLQLARSNRKILNPTGLILSTVPQSFMGNSFEEFRCRMEYRAQITAQEEERRRQDREDMNRWLRQDRDKYQAIVNDLSKSQKERDDVEKRLREYANLDL